MQNINDMFLLGMYNFTLEMKIAKLKISFLCVIKTVSEAMFKIFAVYVKTILNFFFLSRLLAPHLSKLPMPEDYALMELKDLTRSYMLEVTQ